MFLRSYNSPVNFLQFDCAAGTRRSTYSIHLYMSMMPSESIGAYTDPRVLLSYKPQSHSGDVWLRANTNVHSLRVCNFVLVLTSKVRGQLTVTDMIGEIQILSMVMNN